MENNQTASTGGVAAPVISIAFYGNAGEDAEQLREALAQSPAEVMGVSERGRGEVDMAAAEIVITIVATAAAKAVASVALGYVEAYVRRKIEERKGGPDLQLVLKRGEDGKTVDRIPFSFGTMGLEALASFSKNIRGAIEKI